MKTVIMYASVHMSKRSFSLTLIGAYFSLSEIRKIPSLSFCNFLIYASPFRAKMTISPLATDSCCNTHAI